MAGSMTTVTGAAKPVEEATDRDRGSVLTLVAVVLFVVLTVAALAVDLSALERRGQTLQNTADAAALAGVAVWQESADPALTQARVTDLLAQNGVTGDDIEVEINPLGADELEVVLTDNDPDVFLGGLVNGLRGDLERAATARLENCDNSCNVVRVLVEHRSDGFLRSGDRFGVARRGG